MLGLDDPDGASLQVSNMVRDAIKPDLTMFLHYETLTVDGKKIIAVEIQQGTERPYYIAKKGLRPEGVYVRQGYSFRASTFISIYTDRMEFTSIGGLVSGVTLKDVTMGISVCRNAKLANVFYRLELIEAYGTGILKIMDAYEGTKMTPRMETSDNAFKIILPNLNAKREQKELENTGSDSSAAEEKVIALAKERGFVTRKEVEILLGISQTTCGRLLKHMAENGLIVQEGKGRNTHYCLPEKSKRFRAGMERLLLGCCRWKTVRRGAREDIRTNAREHEQFHKSR